MSLIILKLLVELLIEPMIYLENTNIELLRFDNNYCQQNHCE